MMLSSNLCAVAALCLTPAASPEKPITLHTCDSVKGMRLSTGGKLADAKRRLVSARTVACQGKGCLEVTATAPKDARKNTYLSIDVPVPATDVRRRAIAFDAWSGAPDSTAALYVRAYDKQDRCVASWASWKSELKADKQRFELVPGISLRSLQWEPRSVKAPLTSPITRLRFYVGTRHAGKPISLFLDHIQAVPANVRLFSDVKTPKKLYPKTALVVDGKAQCVIVTPAAKPWPTIAARIAAAVRKATGARIPVRQADAVTDDDLKQTHAIVLGSVLDNRRLLYPYSHGLVFADGVYPGAGGHETRTVHDPWGAGRNLVVLGAADPAGAEAAAQCFLAKVKPGANLVIDPFADTHLTGETKQRYGAAFTRKLNKKWEAAERSRAESGLKRGVHCGLFGQAGSMSQYYALTRRAGYAKMFAWLIRRAYSHYQTKPKTYGGPWGMDSDFRIYGVMPGWDAVEECPDLSDADRMEITRILFQWVTEVGRKANSSRANKRVRFNHQTFPALGLLMAGHYFNRYYQSAAAKQWLATAHECFAVQIETNKPHCDCNTYQWLTLYHTMRYSLATGNLKYFESGLARQNVDYAILTMNNLGYQVPYGDVGGWGPISTDAWLLRAADWFYRDGRSRWAIEKKQAIRPLMATGAFDAGAAGAPAKTPTDLVGVHVVPLPRPWFDTFGRSQPVPFEQTYDKVAFRAGFEPDDAYLLLDGLSLGGHGHMDGNSVLQWTQNGRIWLADADYIKSLPKYHNTLLVLRNGQSVRIPGFSRCEGAADLPTLGVSRTTTPGYAGADWTRCVVWLKGRCFVVLDRVQATEPGEFSLRAIWQTVGEVTLDGARMDVEQKGQHARIALAAGTHCLLADDRDTGRNWGSYPYLTQPIVRVLQGIVNRKLAKGDSAYLATVLHASGTAPSSADIRQVGDASWVVTGVGDPVLLSLADGQGRVTVEGVAEAKADLLVATGESLHAIKATELTAGGKRQTFAAPTDVELAAGKATVVVSPRLAPCKASPWQGDLALSAEAVASAKDAIARLLARPSAAKAAAGPADAGAKLEAAWTFANKPKHMLLTNNAGVYGAVDAGLKATCTPEPLPANVFSGQVGANTLANATDGHDQATGDSVMWDDDQEVTVELRFDRVCQLDRLKASVWFGASSSKGKRFMLGRLRLVASNDGFASDTRTLIDFTDKKMRPSWGSPIRYPFKGLKSEAKAVRLILTPRPGTGIYIAELELWGKAEGVVMTAGKTAFDPIACVHAADLDADGVDEIVAGAKSGMLLCLDDKGKLRWQFETRGPVEAVGTADLAGDKRPAVLAGGIGARLYAMDGAGKALWQFDVPTYKKTGHIRTIFAADLDGKGRQTAVAGCDNWRYYAVDAAGKERWHYESVHPSTRGAAVDLDGDGRQELVLGTRYYTWHGVNTDGSRRWGYRTAGGPCANAVAVGNAIGDARPEVFFGGADSLVQAADAKGKRLWQFNTGDEVTAVACVDVDGDGLAEILVSSLSFNVYCLKGDGTLLWRRDLGNPVRDIVATEVGGKLLMAAGADDGRVWLLGASDGAPVGSFRMGGAAIDLAAANLSGGRRGVAAASADGRLYMIELPK